ncbi:hypothetical protein Bbelb_273350 [Branchiostoma belcheri]|nr:hypothetical protein Bbelb_273350 [Branchiostoma belcheri]
MNTIAEEKHVVTSIKEDVEILAHTDSKEGNSPSSTHDLQLCEVIRHIRDFSHQHVEKKQEEEDQDEWKMAALVLDRALITGSMKIVLCLFLFITLFIWIPGSVSQDVAVALKASLLSNYDKSLRPVKSASTAVNVDFDISLKQIIDLYWVDEYLTWNASEHGGVDSLTIHSSDIWRPDIFLYNNIAETYGAIEPITDVTVTSDGRVSYLQPAIFTSACLVDITKFPFDKQECLLEFGSWIYDGGKVNISLVNPTADRGIFTLNEEWILNGVPMTRLVTIYPCCPDPYVTISSPYNWNVGPTSTCSTWFSPVSS